VTPVPLQLPLGAGDAGQLAEFIFSSATGRPLREDVRNRVQALLHSVKLETLRPYVGSLAADPVHPSAYFIAADGLAQGRVQPVLLRIAPSSTPASALYPKSLLIGRMRAGLGPEVVVNAVPFGPSDHDHVLRFAAEIDSAFQPRPQGARAAFSVAASQPALVFPAAFHAFRYLLRNRGINHAAFSPAADTPAAIRDTETAAVWAAIRAGWRDGFTLELEPPRELLAEAAGYTGFIAGPELEAEIAAIKAGRGSWKRFDPEPALRLKTRSLTAILDAAAPAAVSDAIVDFAVT
jgi:hypothetical protein